MQLQRMQPLDQGAQHSTAQHSYRSACSTSVQPDRPLSSLLRAHSTATVQQRCKVDLYMSHLGPDSIWHLNKLQAVLCRLSGLTLSVEMGCVKLPLNSLRSAGLAARRTAGGCQTYKG
jgi:hypothetical protein